MAKRVLSRSEREDAGLCGKGRYEAMLPALRAALKQIASPEIVEAPWPWTDPANLASCGYAGAPEALDLELTLRIEGSPGGTTDRDRWLTLSGFTLDAGKSWVLERTSYAANGSYSTIDIAKQTRDEIRAFLQGEVKWLAKLREPYGLDIQTRNVINYRDFDAAPPGTKYIVRANIRSEQDQCASLFVQLRGGAKFSVLGLKQEPPHQCPPPVH